MAFKTRRRMAGKGLTETATFLGVSRQAICAWERGERFPKFTRLKAITEYYGCTVEELLAPDEDEAAKEG